MNRDELYPNPNLEEEDWRRSMLELVRRLREDAYDKINEPASRFRATRGAAQSIPDATFTKVQYNTEDFDNLGEDDHVTDFRFTAQKAGYYQVNAGAMFVSKAVAAGTACAMDLYKNGSSHTAFSRYYYSAVTVYMRAGGSDVIYLGADDYIEIFIYQNSGAATNLYADSIYNYFSAHRLS